MEISQTDLSGDSSRLEAEFDVYNGLVLLQLTLHGAFNTRTAMYMIQELSAKGSIASNIPRDGMPEAQCRQLMTGIIAGLQFIHKHNIIHRLKAFINYFCNF